MDQVSDDPSEEDVLAVDQKWYNEDMDNIDSESEIEHLRSLLIRFLI